MYEEEEMLVLVVVTCLCVCVGGDRGAEVMCLGVLGDGVSFSSLLHRVRLVLCTSRSGQI